MKISLINRTGISFRHAARILRKYMKDQKVCEFMESTSE